MPQQYEIWERRIGGTWRSVLDSTDLSALKGQVYRWSVSLTGHTREWVVLPVGQFPDRQTEPTHTNARVVARSTDTGSTRRKSALGSDQ